MAIRNQPGFPVKAEEVELVDAFPVIVFITGIIALALQELLGEHDGLHVLVRPFPAPVKIILLQMTPKKVLGTVEIEVSLVSADEHAAAVVVRFEYELLR